MNSSKIFLCALVCTAFVFVNFDHCMGHFEFLIFTVGSAQSIRAEAMVPGFSIALEDMARKYPALYQNYTTMYLDIESLDDSACTPVAPWKFAERISRLYGSGSFQSTDDVKIMLAPEMDLLTLYCGPALIPDARRYPTLITGSAGAALELGISLIGLLDMFHWKKVSIMSDSGSQRIDGTLQIVMTAFNRRLADFDILTTHFYSENQSDGYIDALIKSGQHSRIIVVAALDGSIRKILVFIYLYSVQIPGEPPIIWKFRNETIEQKVLDAFESVLVLRYVLTDWDDWSSTTERIHRRRKELFGSTLNSEMQFNELVLACYESMEIVSQLLNETFGKDNLQWKARDIARRVSGRTFSLSHQNISFTTDGRRIPQFILQQYSTVMTDFKIVMNFDIPTRKWFFSSTTRFTWRDGKVPEDSHPCGFYNDQCISSSRTFQGLLISAAVFCLLIVTALIFRYHQRIQKSLKWWLLDDSLLLFPVPDKQTKSIIWKLWHGMVACNIPLIVPVDPENTRHED